LARALLFILQQPSSFCNYFDNLFQHRLTLALAIVAAVQIVTRTVITVTHAYSYVTTKGLFFVHDSFSYAPRARLVWNVGIDCGRAAGLRRSETEARGLYHARNQRVLPAAPSAEPAEVLDHIQVRPH